MLVDMKCCSVSERGTFSAILLCASETAGADENKYSQLVADREKRNKLVVFVASRLGA